MPKVDVHTLKNMLIFKEEDAGDEMLDEAVRLTAQKEIFVIKSQIRQLETE